MKRPRAELFSPWAFSFRIHAIQFHQRSYVVENFTPTLTLPC